MAAKAQAYSRQVLCREYLSSLLPADFDDDTRIAEAILRHHPPRELTAP